MDCGEWHGQTDGRPKVRPGASRLRDSKDDDEDKVAWTVSAEFDWFGGGMGSLCKGVVSDSTNDGQIGHFKAIQKRLVISRFRIQDEDMVGDEMEWQKQNKLNTLVIYDTDSNGEPTIDFDERYAGPRRCPGRRRMET
eukprot:TRINITY_DN6103_c0_g1_i1.p2 TRINITY_DN6103_c0_g1~~TRINITY_DN6103_c0_g1_i1.p2  ORF type:complete len:138 (+),score=15.34 TRINITY_DN6103_c0_g1_i1:212-625(+)